MPLHMSRWRTSTSRTHLARKRTHPTGGKIAGARSQTLLRGREHRDIVRFNTTLARRHPPALLLTLRRRHFKPSLPYVLRRSQERKSSMVLHLNAASKTDVGQQREQNEDACYAHVIENDSQVSGLFVVADGMGGYHAGEVAAKIAVDTISELLQPLLGPTSSQPTVRLKGKRGRGKDTRESRDDPAKTRPLSETNHDGEMVAASSDATEQRSAPETQQLSESIVLEHYTDRLKAAVEQSSEAIVEYGRQHAEAKGLGSTVTVAMIAGDQAFIANVGDSRTYLFRDGKLHRLTHDHSLVERLVEAGQIEPE